MTHVLLALGLLLAMVRVPVITLERTACFGSCPVYKVTIFDDGTVMFDGKESVKRPGMDVSRISTADVEALVREFEKLDYNNLAEAYVDDPKLCPEQETDMPSAITSLELRGKKKTVRHYYGCNGTKILEQLTALESKIDEVAKTDQWVK